MLAQVALIAFAMFALLGLIVDAGLARITQAQMQAAADAAALEGLRNRDIGVMDTTGQPMIDPFASDCLRRTASRRIVRSLFDDDLDPTSEDPDHSFGAGPIIDLTDGATSLHAHPMMSVPDEQVYKPALQLNQQNAVYGDMVSGRFCYNADPAPSEGPSRALSGDLVCGEPQRVSGSYARNDFNPNPDAPQAPAELPTCPGPDDPPPASWPRSGARPLTTEDDSAFLVRLRRSNELRDFTGQTEPDVASSGPSLPLLFGRGAPIHGDNPESPYSIRRDGITVRATAIAAVRPAMHVGLPQVNPTQRGVTPFALRDTFVQTLSATGTPVTINPANGIICRGLTCAGVTPATSAGRFVDSLTDPSRARWTLISTVGQALPAAPAAVACAAALPASGYGPVYSLMTSGANRIIGFVRVGMVRDPQRPGPANACAAVVTRGVSLIAESNATAILTEGLPLPLGAQPNDIRELLDKHFERDGQIAYGPVLVPVLVR